MNNTYFFAGRCPSSLTHSEPPNGTFTSRGDSKTIALWTITTSNDNGRDSGNLRKIKKWSKTLVNGASFDPTFYKNVDFDGMLKYLLTNRKLDSKHVKDIVSYFRRFQDLFFGTRSEEILKFQPPKRGWIIQAMSHFGNYYFHKTNNPECKELIDKIINRYGLNIGLDMYQRIYIVDDNFVRF